MSLLNKASLIQIPSGYKDGTLYSAKPTNGDGDFTFSRGSNLAATRVNSDGLIEKGRENLFLHSNDFSQGAWSQNTQGVTRTSSSVTDPDGGTDAWEITTTATTDTHRLGHNINSGPIKTISFYAKANGYDYVRVWSWSGGNTNSNYFYLSGDGSVGGNGYGGIRKIESLGDGWYRCQCLIDGANVDTIVISPAPDENIANSTNSYLGDGTSGIYLFQAQLEAGLVATDYIPTTTTTEQAGILEDMPRLDYSGGATCPSLLLEPQRSNLITHSELGTDWTVQGGLTTNNQTTSPENYTNGVKFLESATTGNHGFYKQLNLSASTDYAVSVFVKKLGRRYVGLQSWWSTDKGAIAYFDLDDVQAEGTYSEGTGYSVSNAKIEDYGNDWYRISAVFQSGEITQFFGLVAMDSLWTTGTSYDNTYAGDVTKGFYSYGLQVEEGSYPTSYIPTYGASVTRNTDAHYKLNAESLIGQTEGTMYVEVPFPAKESNGRYMTLSKYTAESNYRIVLYASAANQVTLYVADGSQQVGSTPQNMLSGINKIALAYAQDDYALYLNGTLIHTDNNASVPLCNKITIGTNEFDLSADTPSVSKAMLFKTRLSNEELAILTTL